MFSDILDEKGPRIQALERSCPGEELAESLNLSQQRVSFHLFYLVQASQVLRSR